MLRLEFYAQQMLRHDARQIELISNEPATFLVASGQRRSNRAIEHQQLVALVEEAASDDQWQSFEQQGLIHFVYQSESAALIDVQVEILGPEQWRVVLNAQSSAKLSDQPSPIGSGAPEPIEGSSTQQIPYGSVGVYQVASETAEVAVVRNDSLHEVDTTQVLTGSSGGSIDDLLHEMVRKGASDLHLSAGCAPMIRLHGDMVKMDSHGILSSEELSRMLEPLMPERNRREFARSRDTDFGYVIESIARFRCNVFVDRKGVCAVFRQIPIEILSPHRLGIPPQVLDLCWLSKGLVLVTGPTGSGKSTTLASLIDVINSERSDHIITIEDPIEFVHDNKKCLVNQREVNSHTNSFKSALRAALREDPDIVLVGEMRDLETISIAIETAETGHLVFGTLHTTTASSTVDRVIDQFPAEQQAQIRVMLSESLKGVISQTLCRTIAGKRAAAYEVLVVTPAISNLIREGKTFQIPSAIQTGKKYGMQMMNDQLISMVKQQLVSPQEAYLKAGDKDHLLHLFQQNQIAFSAQSLRKEGVGL